MTDSTAHGRIIMDERRLSLTLERLCHQLVEKHGEFENTCLIALQPRGVMLGERLYRRLEHITGGLHPPYGKLDFSLYRDDYRTRARPIPVQPTVLDFLVGPQSIDGRKVILIDDVLYTGRTVAAALRTLYDYGRPARVELLVLIDRRFNRELPIHCDYVGMRVDALDEAYVRVVWATAPESGRVLLYPDRKAAENDLHQQQQQND